MKIISDVYEIIICSWSGNEVYGTENQCHRYIHLAHVYLDLITILDIFTIDILLARHFGGQIMKTLFLFQV